MGCLIGLSGYNLTTEAHELTVPLVHIVSLRVSITDASLLLLRTTDVDFDYDVLSHVITLSDIGSWALPSLMPLLLYAFLSGWLDFSSILILYMHTRSS